MIDPWPRLLRATSELPLDTAEAAVVSLAPSYEAAMAAIRDVHAGRRQMSSVLRQYGISRSEAQNRGKVLLYLSSDLGLLQDVGGGRYRATAVGGGVREAAQAQAAPAAARRRARSGARRIRRPSDVRERENVDGAPGTATVRVDLDVLRERTAEHQRVVRECAREFIEAGCEVYEANFDLLAICGETATLVEAKTVTPLSERTQVKLAIGQLMTYSVDDAVELVGDRRLIMRIATNVPLTDPAEGVLRRLGIETRVYPG